MHHGLGLFEHIMDSAVLLDKAGRIVDWNQGATSLFGFSRKEVIGRSINLIYDHNHTFPKLIQELAGSSRKWNVETVFVRKNGNKGSCKSILCALSSKEEPHIAALLMHQNISTYQKKVDDLLSTQAELEQDTENQLAAFLGVSKLLAETFNSLEQTEKKLRESELHFSLLAENVTDIISRHALDGTFLYASPSCKSAMGYQPQDLVGKNIFKYVHHDDISKIKKTINRRKEDPSKTIVYRIRRKDGEFRWFESSMRLILNEQRKVSEIQLASRDITDRVLDKKARLRGQQLAHVYRLSTMEEMASGMAHEISQPLAAIVNYTRGCVRHLQNGQQDTNQLTNIMEKAAIQAERAGEIIQRLKNFFCKGQLIKTPCKMNNIIREATTLIKNQLSATKTKVDFDFDKDLPPISIDKIQVQQVVLNLVQNAMESMQECHTRDKRIQIKTKISPENNIDVIISDSGPGFSKEVTNKVFKPFFTTKAHGRGMGLAICRSIIEAHGGQFTINPNTSNSSWIGFSLPI